MIQYEDDGTKKAFCDRCSKELTETVVLLASGDAICQDCFDNEHNEVPVSQYLNEA